LNPNNKEDFILDGDWSTKVAYLVQGHSELVQEEFRRIEFGPNVIALTWDCELPEEGFPSNVQKFFFPNSTWAEGRNKLLELATSIFRGIDYYVFLDDDVAFTKSSLSEFERLILGYRPMIAVPLCDRIIREMSFSYRTVERPIRHDQILMAFHKSVIDDGIVLPIDTKFDEVSWWLTCELNHYLIQRYYADNILIFNGVVIENSNHSHEDITNSDRSEKTLYKARYTSVELERLKFYIESRYGSQPSILDTIFQPKIFNKIRVTNLNRVHIERLFLIARQGRFFEFLKLLFRIAITIFTNTIYQIIWPRKMLSSRI
jgi:hypothetical protein